ncbi:MAG: cell wall synthesis protein CwsA, partial [Calditrichia bacterium]|nr:cell wall synthesis protein CwsA [Calditrichia bacterium]
KVAEQITISKQKKGEKKFPWLWASLGAVVVAGGAVAVLVLGGKSTEEEPSSSLPDPDWPPN